MLVQVRVFSLRWIARASLTWQSWGAMPIGLGPLKGREQRRPEEGGRHPRQVWKREDWLWGRQPMLDYPLICCGLLSFLLHHASSRSSSPDTWSLMAFQSTGARAKAWDDYLLRKALNGSHPIPCPRQPQQAESGTCAHLATVTESLVRLENLTSMCWGP